MRQNLFVIFPAGLGVASAVYAQEALKGEVATVDEASGKIGIKLEWHGGVRRYDRPDRR